MCVGLNWRYAALYCSLSAFEREYCMVSQCFRDHPDGTFYSRYVDRDVTDLLVNLCDSAMIAARRRQLTSVPDTQSVIQQPAVPYYNPQRCDAGRRVGC